MIVINDTDVSIWTGRVDDADGMLAKRWHQCRVSGVGLDGVDDLSENIVLLGFACDEGVARNQGRVGARQGPSAIRAALANLAVPENFQFLDLGDVVCVDKNLEECQTFMAGLLAQVIEKNGFPVVLGGGHDLAWASYLGAQTFVAAEHQAERNNLRKRLGIINFDAHFDLRNPAAGASSGTPFRQCNEYCQQHALPFDYFVLGINPSANTQALFAYAAQHGVRWLEDIELCQMSLGDVESQLADYIQKLDYLYLTICLDVFCSSVAPGVSAPAALGVDPHRVIALLDLIKRLCAQYNTPVLLCDIAEMNPQFDRDQQTAKLAARLLYHLIVE